MLRVPTLRDPVAIIDPLRPRDQGVHDALVARSNASDPLPGPQRVNCYDVTKMTMYSKGYWTFIVSNMSFKDSGKKLHEEENGCASFIYDWRIYTDSTVGNSSDAIFTITKFKSGCIERAIQYVYPATTLVTHSTT